MFQFESLLLICFLIYFGLTDEIDLLNVSFDGHLAPDRQSAKAGLSELRRVAPSRKYAIYCFSICLSFCSFVYLFVFCLNA